jgi:hypothetical protein
MKRSIWLLLLLALLVGACRSQATPAVEPTLAPTVVVKFPTAEPDSPGSSFVTAEPGCTVVSPQPTADPTQNAKLPPATEDDWKKGPDTAAVTIIEYSDFQ